LRRIADKLEERADELGRLESANAGKPVGAAIDEIAVCADLFRFFAGAARTMDGLAANEFLAGHMSIIRRDPIGSSPRSRPGTTRSTWRAGSWARPWRPATRSSSSPRHGHR